MSKIMDIGYSDARGAIVNKAGIGVLFASGTTVPTDASIGYAPGCIFIDENDQTGGLYINEGSATSSDFNGVWSPDAGPLTLASGDLTLTSGNVVLTAGNLTFTAASDINIAAATAAAFEVYDATTKILGIDTRITLKNTNTVQITGVPVTVASEAASHSNPSLALLAKTITYTGGTGTTAHNGAMLYVGVPTFTDASAMTLSVASSVYINAVAAAGGMLTISASYMIHTSVSGCFLSNAGVWTDMACWESGKEFVNRSVDYTTKAIEALLSRITPATWKYKAMTELPAIAEDGTETIHRTPIRDKGRERVGIIYDDLPDELRAPGEETAVSTGVLSSFALAAIKMLYEQNQELEARLSKAGL